MDDYLQCMKTLRSQINDVEDQAAKISVEEQTRVTTIDTLLKDLNSAKCETKRFKEDTEQMVKAKGEICSQILEKQRKIASLESDSSTLSQTLELIQHERITISAKVKEKSAYYTKVAEDINAKLREQQAWINSHKLRPEAGVHELVKDKIHEETGEAEGNPSFECHLVTDGLNHEAMKNLMTKLGFAKTGLDGITEMKYKLVSENNKIRQSIEQTRQRTNDFKPELRAMDLETLEEEHKALLSDKGGETEYLQSLQYQIGKLKAISHVVKCGCGEEYKVEVETCT